MNFYNYKNEIIKISEIFNKNNYELFLVGGSIRDILMNKNPVDFDFTTNASPFEITKLFPKNFQTGIKYGTISIIFNKKIFEITTYRTDKEYKNKRHPSETKFTKELKKDLERRDFTINAIAMDLIKNNIVDLYNGILDIKRKIIKCIGNPVLRFEEDALRILRACRFASTLGFNIEKNTLLTMKYKKDNIGFLSKERIQSEFIKLLKGKNPEKGVIYLNKIKFFKTFFSIELSKKLIKKIKFLNQTNYYLKAILILTIKTNVLKLKKALMDLKFSNKEIKKIMFYRKIIENKNFFKKNNLSSIRFFLYKTKKENYLDILDLYKVLRFKKRKLKFIKKNIKKNYIFNAPLSLKDLKINGYDIEKLKIIEKKNIGKMLNFLLKIVLENPNLNKKEILIEKIKNTKF